MTSTTSHHHTPTLGSLSTNNSLGSLELPINSSQSAKSLSPTSAVSSNESLNNSSPVFQKNIIANSPSVPITPILKPLSPSPSITSERNDVDLEEKHERQEESKKRRLQLYVFVSRCIAHPFNAKQPTDMTRRQTKITKHQLDNICMRFQSFFKGNYPNTFRNKFETMIDKYLKQKREFFKLVQ